jgi:MoxR-like ATPase
MTKSSEKRNRFLAAVADLYGDRKTITRQEIIEVCTKYDLSRPVWLTKDPAYRAGRGEYNLPSATGSVPVAAKSKKAKNSVVQPIVPISNSIVNMAPTSEATVLAMPGVESKHSESYVPDKVQGYVPFGHFNDVRKIIDSKKFYPMYITGLSGNGKTMMIEQACAQSKRECIRVNVTIETDEDDLIGGFRLVNGHTVWQNGPVVVAMERGAILLLDEVDLGSNKLMCLQPILEGHSVLLKKINGLVHPKEGFNIIATANTKGRGSDDGKFVGTNVMNEAFLERFSITLEQDYPALKTEAKILKNVLAKSNIEDSDFVEKLVKWGEGIRKTYADGAVSDIISTRRLVHICEAFAIFNDREKAIELCLNRFDSDTKNAFMDLYKKLDENLTPKEAAPEAASTEASATEYPF